MFTRRAYAVVRAANRLGWPWLAKWAKLRSPNWLKLPLVIGRIGQNLLGDPADAGRTAAGSGGAHVAASSPGCQAPMAPGGGQKPAGQSGGTESWPLIVTGSADANAHAGGDRGGHINRGNASAEPACPVAAWLITAPVRLRCRPSERTMKAAWLIRTEGRSIGVGTPDRHRGERDLGSRSPSLLYAPLFHAVDRGGESRFRRFGRLSPGDGVVASDAVPSVPCRTSQPEARR